MKRAHAQNDSFVAAVDTELGQPEYNRRLSDKILAAFNHAYAIHERRIAKLLRAMLKDVERGSRMGPGKRRAGNALGQADLWIAFVEARDHYRALSADQSSGPEAVAEALDEMKETYKQWSYS
jgi:hypothetical protein